MVMVFCGYEGSKLAGASKCGKMKESNLSRLKDRGVGGFLLKHIVSEQMDHINYLLFRPD